MAILTLRFEVVHPALEDILILTQPTLKFSRARSYYYYYYYYLYYYYYYYYYYHHHHNHFTSCFWWKIFVQLMVGMQSQQPWKLHYIIKIHIVSLKQKNAIIEIILCPNFQNSKIICKKSRSRYRSSPTIKDKGFCDRTQWFIVINYCHKSHHTTRSRYLESVSENRTS